MSEPAAWPPSTAVETPEHPPLEATDRREVSPEEAAMPVPAAEGPEDTWEAPEAPAPASTAPAKQAGGLDALDRHIRTLEDEIRRLKSG